MFTFLFISILCVLSSFSLTIITFFFLDLQSRFRTADYAEFQTIYHCLENESILCLTATNLEPFYIVYGEPVLGQCFNDSV